MIPKDKPAMPAAADPLDQPVERAVPTPGDRARLEGALRRKGQESTEPDPVPMPPPADAILAGLRAPAEPPAPPPAEAVRRPQAILPELVRAVIDRMTVSESGPAGQQEVRIVLKDDVLGGTEVRISEHAGAVQVTFVAGTDDAGQFLAARQQEISSALAGSLRRDVRVEVIDRGGEAGRARNRRFLPGEREG